MAPKGVKTGKGIWYWPTRDAAVAYAREHGFPTDRVLDFAKGWAIQLYASGPYVGPGVTPVTTDRFDPSTGYRPLDWLGLEPKKKLSGVGTMPWWWYRDRVLEAGWAWESHVDAARAALDREDCPTARRHLREAFLAMEAVGQQLKEKHAAGWHLGDGEIRVYLGDVADAHDAAVAYMAKTCPESSWPPAPSALAALSGWRPPWT